MSVENGSTYYETGKEPDKVVFIGENQNVSYFLPDSNGSEWDRGKATGMTEQEYKRFFIPELFSNSAVPKK